MWVQDVYRHGGERIAVGTVRSGRLRAGDTVRISPAGKSARVAALRGGPAIVIPRPRAKRQPLCSIRRCTSTAVTCSRTKTIHR